MASPFFVQPAQFGQGLQSLAGSVQQFGQQQRAQEKAAEQEAYEKAAKEAMGKALQSGDPRMMVQVATQYPEVSETMQQLFGFTNDQTRQVSREAYSRAIADPENAARYLDAAAETVTQLGGTPRNILADRDMIMRDPEKGMQRIRMGFAGVAPDLSEKFERQVVEGAEGTFTYDPATNQYKRQDGAPVTMNQAKLAMAREAQALKSALAMQKAGEKQDEAKIKRADTLRGEVTKKAKELGIDKTFAAMNRIEASNDGSAAGDLSLIFNYMKMLDPGSVVREGEFATAQNAAGVPQRIINLYNQARTGERLSQEQRSNFTDQARKIYSKAKNSFEQSISPYLDLARQSNIPKDELLGEGFFESFSVIDESESPQDESDGGQQRQAPQAAIDYLRQNPGMAEQFRAKYGYLPEGF